LKRKKKEKEMAEISPIEVDTIDNDGATT